MKKIFIICFLFCGSYCTFAQKINRIAYVDIEYILENLEEYKIANTQFAEKVALWKKEIDLKHEEIQKRKEKLEAEKPILTAELVKDKEEEIQVLEHNLHALQQKRFGAENGDYIKQKWQLAQPIQDQIFNIAQEIGKTRQYEYIFTKEDAATIYADQKYDITKFVLRMLKRKDNAEDRNKDMATLLKENYNYELKDEKTKRREENERKRAELVAKNIAEREARKKQLAAEREAKLKERQEKIKQLQAEKQAQKEAKLKEKQTSK